MNIRQKSLMCLNIVTSFQWFNVHVNLLLSRQKIPESSRKTWNSQRGLSGEIAIPRANRTDGTTAMPNIVRHLIK
jgi:hypothetical protein